MQNLSYEYEFYLLENKKSYICINGFALNLALKLRLGTNWKWPQIFIYLFIFIILTDGNQLITYFHQIVLAVYHCITGTPAFLLIFQSVYRIERTKRIMLIR